MHREFIRVPLCNPCVSVVSYFLKSQSISSRDAARQSFTVRS